MRNIKLVLQYDGTNFCGYELQPGKRSVRGEIEKALHKLFKIKTRIIGVSRTDSGVHAIAQVVNFKTTNQIPTKRIPAALNSCLKDDIRILGAEEKGKEFNSRYAAKSKEYEYLIFNGAIIPPSVRRVAWHIKYKLDLAAMKEAAKILVGKHDFSSFCASRSDDKNFVKRIYKLSIKKRKLAVFSGEKIDLVSVRVKGDGFLYKMVRNMVGTLMEVGLGNKITSDIKNILYGRNRRLAGRTAPSHGLCLIKVHY
ncbi:MAG: tRNA pseudouridine(38-40) synthase TruA [Candidatus Margulisiibacteriota bacterium]|nr:tRNA pseudouridine(38-40) synthase TruA [Candidatus Margulisiibacteriota bacterium]